VHHKLRLNKQERIEAWLSLCDVTFKLMKDNLNKTDFLKKMERIRAEKIKAIHSTLKGISRTAYGK